MGSTSAPSGNVSDSTGKVSLDLKVGYAATEKLKLQGMAKFTLCPPVICSVATPIT